MISNCKDANGLGGLQRGGKGKKCCYVEEDGIRTWVSREGEGMCVYFLTKREGAQVSWGTSHKRQGVGKNKR